MCTYNGGLYLLEQLESLAVQTRLPDEVVVCDDMSSDETRDIVQAFAAVAPFPVSLHVNETNLGSTKNFEKAIELCDGDVIALSDQDDVWLPKKLQQTVRLLAADAEVGAVFTDAEVVDANLKPLGYRLWSAAKFDQGKQRLVREGKGVDLLINDNYATGSTMVFRAKYKELLLPIPYLKDCIHDGWIALVIAAVSRLEFIAEPLMLYRQHPGQQIGAKQDCEPADVRENNRENTLDSLLAATTRQTSFDRDIHKCRLVVERLTEKSGSFDCRNALAKVKSKLIHFETRDSLPSERLKRLPRVLRELLTLRYHSYSLGFKSAAKDLFL